MIPFHSSWFLKVVGFLSIYLLSTMCLPVCFLVAVSFNYNVLMVCVLFVHHPCKNKNENNQVHTRQVVAERQTYIVHRS